VLRSGGRAAFIASGNSAPPPPRPDVRSLRPAVGRDRAHLDRLVALVRAGALRLPEITPYPLAEARAAHVVSDARHLRGKLVLLRP
jgi:NADPH:quinone reductase-like Zn-dependent oxidoreductase